MTQPNPACGDESLCNGAANRSEEKSQMCYFGRVRLVEHQTLGKPDKPEDLDLARGFCSSAALHVTVQLRPDILQPCL